MDDSSFSRHPGIPGLRKCSRRHGALPLAGRALTGCWRVEKSALGASSPSVLRACLQEALASTVLCGPQPLWAEAVMTPFYRLANQGTACVGTQLSQHLVLRFLHLKNGSGDGPSPTGLLGKPRDRIT